MRLRKTIVRALAPKWPLMHLMLVGGFCLLAPLRLSAHTSVMVLAKAQMDKEVPSWALCLVLDPLPESPGEFRVLCQYSSSVVKNSEGSSVRPKFGGVLHVTPAELEEEARRAKISERELIFFAGQAQLFLPDPDAYAVRSYLEILDLDDLGSNSSKVWEKQVHVSVQAWVNSSFVPATSWSNASDTEASVQRLRASVNEFRWLFVGYVVLLFLFFGVVALHVRSIGYPRKSASDEPWDGNAGARGKGEAPSGNHSADGQKPSRKTWFGSVRGSSQGGGSFSRLEALAKPLLEREGLMTGDIIADLERLMKRVDSASNNFRALLGDERVGLKDLVDSVRSALSGCGAQNLEALTRKYGDLKKSQREVRKVLAELEGVSIPVAGSTQLDSELVGDEIEGVNRRLQSLSLIHAQLSEVGKPADSAAALSREEYLAKLFSVAARRLAVGAVERGGKAPVDRVLARLGDHFDKLTSLASEADGAQPRSAPLDLLCRRLERAGKEHEELREARAEVEKAEKGLGEIHVLLGSIVSGAEAEPTELAGQVAMQVGKATVLMRDAVGRSDGSFSELVQVLAEEHQEQRLTLDASNQLSLIFRRYLGFSDDGAPEVAGQVHQLKLELREGWSEFRLCVSAALSRWSQLNPAHGSEGERLVSALRLLSIEKKVGLFLERLENHADGAALWAAGLVKGFGGQWLHELLRAELLLDTYYRDETELYEQFEPVRAVAAAFNRLLARIGRGVEPVGLLQPFPVDRPTGWEEPEFHADADLYQLPTVRRRILSRLERGDGFVIDVRSFRLVGDAELRGSCRVVVVSPGDWRQG